MRSKDLSQQDPQHFISLFWYVTVLICHNLAQWGPDQCLSMMCKIWMRLVSQILYQT